MDRNERFAETIHLFLRFAFGRLDHHGSRNGPRDRRRMVAVIHQTLGHVFHRDTLELAKIENAFVGHQIAMAAVENGIEVLQPASDVVGIEDSVLACFSQASAPHGRDIHPGDR